MWLDVSLEIFTALWSGNLSRLGLRRSELSGLASAGCELCLDVGGAALRMRETSHRDLALRGGDRRWGRVGRPEN